ncbi:hypothetical protein CTEN210_18261 [Chaetoceros tenuissimus]|uniref:HSF-type DNA-binding domain-containing protein n=1 Tax=Chaetoceros tenuissimus TaxID=426638 RepID=A0AAD3DE92_9STRA|nr:hypothetical protein CTEN210_18261 [Chaetoceros tenuissimus]
MPTLTYIAHGIAPTGHNIPIITKASDPAPIKQKKAGPSRQAIERTFPQQLMQILSDPNIYDVMRWLQHGRSFMILHPDILVARGCTSVVCKTPTSFIRKLNRWGFHQVKHGFDAGAFYHPLFIRDQPHLCLQMVSKKCPQSKKKPYRRKRRRYAFESTPVRSSKSRHGPRTVAQHSKTKNHTNRIVTPSSTKNNTDQRNNQTEVMPNSSSPTPTNASITKNPNVGGYLYTPAYYWPPSYYTTATNASFVHPYYSTVGPPFPMHGSYRIMTPHR